MDKGWRSVTHRECQFRQTIIDINFNLVHPYASKQIVHHLDGFIPHKFIVGLQDKGDISWAPWLPECLVTSENAGADILRCFFQFSPPVTRTLGPNTAKARYISTGLGNRERETVIS